MDGNIDMGDDLGRPQEGHGCPHGAFLTSYSYIHICSSSSSCSSSSNSSSSSSSSSSIYIYIGISCTYLTSNVVGYFSLFGECLEPIWHVGEIDFALRVAPNGLMGARFKTTKKFYFFLPSRV